MLRKRKKKPINEPPQEGKFVLLSPCLCGIIFIAITRKRLSMKNISHKQTEGGIMKKAEIDLDSLIESKEYSIKSGNKEYFIRLVGIKNLDMDLGKQSSESRIIKRRNGIMKLRKAVRAPLDFSNYTPLTKDEIHQD